MQVLTLRSYKFEDLRKGAPLLKSKMLFLIFDCTLDDKNMDQLCSGRAHPRLIGINRQQDICSAVIINQSGPES